MKEIIVKNKKNILIILGVIIAIVVLIIKIFFGNDKQSNINIVKSSSKFYTVSNCVSRYINYLYSEDIDNVILLLEKNYKKKNNINNDNLFKKINKLDNFYSFSPTKMYEEVINDNLTKYYVKGYLVPDDLDFFETNKVEYYIIVYFNNKKSTYSIVPYDGKLFKNGDNNEKK